MYTKFVKVADHLIRTMFGDDFQLCVEVIEYSWDITDAEQQVLDGGDTEKARHLNAAIEARIEAARQKAKASPSRWTLEECLAAGGSLQSLEPGALVGNDKHDGHSCRAEIRQLWLVEDFGPNWSEAWEPAFERSSAKAAPYDLLECLGVFEREMLKSWTMGYQAGLDAAGPTEPIQPVFIDGHTGTTTPGERFVVTTC